MEVNAAVMTRPDLLTGAVAAVASTHPGTAVLRVSRLVSVALETRVAAVVLFGADGADGPVGSCAAWPVELAGEAALPESMATEVRAGRAVTMSDAQISAAAVPVMVRGTVQGAVFTHREAGVAWPAADVQMLEDLAGMLGSEVDLRMRIAEESRQLHESATLSEERFRAVFENAAIGIAVGDMQGNMLATNAALQNMLGYTHEELVAGPQPLPAHPEDTAKDWDLFLELIAGKRDHYQMEKRVLKRDGSILWGRLTVSLIRSSDGAPQYVIGMLEDVTERQHAQQELTHSEERYRRLVELSPDAILVHLGGQVRFANEAAARMLGVPDPGVLTDRNVFEFVPQERVGFWRGLLDELETGRSFNVAEGEFVRVDGSIFFGELAATQFMMDGVPAVQVVVRDLTERKRAEDALQRSQAQLRQAQKMDAVGRLAGGIAHDFNNLLTAIKGHTYMALEELSTGHPARAELDEVAAAADRAESLTRQMLAFSRKQTLQPRVLDLHEVVRGLQPMLRRLIGEDIDLTTELGAAPLVVRADPGQLEQVLLNLVVNARDATTSGGSITISTSTQADNGTAPFDAGPHAQLTVRDTGTGIDAATLPHIFEPFFTTKPMGQGTGLGLSTVYGIVVQSGGHITVESVPGHGSAFHVHFPLVDAKPETGSEPPSTAPVGGSETILLVEDEAGVRSLASRVLKRNGYEVLEAGDGEEALDIASLYRGAIDLVVTDVIMPRVNGPQLAERLKLLRPGTPVLFMSGYTWDVVMERGALDEGAMLLEKPFTPQAFAQKVREVLTRA